MKIIKYSREFKVFTRFLKENSAFIGYFKEMKRNNNNHSSFFSVYDKNFNRFFNECQPISWLEYCFYWGETIMGHDYWHKLSKKWVNVLYDII